MTDDERLARNMAKLDAQRAIREREAAAIKSQRDTAAGKRDEYGNPPTRKRPADQVEATRAKIAALYVAGALASDIAIEVGLSASSVYAHLRHAGIEKRPVVRARKAVPERPVKRRVRPDVTAMAAMYEQGLSCLELGQQFGVSKSRCWQLLTQAGVTMRPRGTRVAA